MPHAAEWDRTKEFPHDALKQCAELGFGGIYLSEDVGGAGLGRLEASLIFEALATACSPTSAFMSIHNMNGWIIDNYGTPEQREKYLPGMIAFDLVSSYCLTEPNSGSDAQAMQSMAVDKGDHFVLSGQKMFISGSGLSDIYLVMTRTGEKEISCLLVEKGMPGLSFGKMEHKLGWNCSHTATVELDEVKVPKENLIGERGNGFKIALSGLDGGRINIASCSLGGAAQCLHYATEYTKSRKQFGRELAKFQSVQFRLADMATDLEASRLMVRNAARLMDDKDENYTPYCAMAKKFATEKCSRIVDDALQLHGGYGYLNEYPIERYLRDLRVHQILEGTSEIMQLIVSRKLLSD